MAPPPTMPLHYDSQLDFPLARTNLGISIVFAVIAAGAFVLRVVARRQTKARLQGDDWAMFVAMIISVAQCIMSAWAAVDGGLGVPSVYLSKATAVAFLKQTFVQELLSTAAIGLIKVSVCLYYKRIFSIDKNFVKWINLLIVVSVAWTLAFFLALTFSFWPVSGHWALGPNAVKHNLNFGALIISMATTSVVLDFTVLSMPIPMIRKLHLSSRKKTIVGIMFGLGAFCVVASIVRLAYIVEFLKVAGHTTSDAFTHAENQIALWSNIEPCASVFCACLPTYGPFVQSFIKGETSLGQGLSAIFRNRFNKSSESASEKGSVSHSTKSSNMSTTSTTRAASTDDKVDEMQLKSQGGITVSRSFGVTNHSGSDSDETALPPQAARSDRW